MSKVKSKVGTITPAIAAQRAGVAPATIRKWVWKYNLGFKVAGRWRIDELRLKKFLHEDEIGKPFKEN